jgi:hypothetical protein
MIGRSGFHGLMRNVRVSPWTRRSLTQSLLLRRSAMSGADDARRSHRLPLSPSASLTFRAWEASVAAILRKDKDV